MPTRQLLNANPCSQVFEPLKVSLKNLEDIYALSDSEDELFEAKVKTYALIVTLQTT